MISPGMSSCEHSLNTLRYADRVKELATDGTDHLEEDIDEVKADTDLAHQDLNLQLIAVSTVQVGLNRNRTKSVPSLRS